MKVEILKEKIKWAVSSADKVTGKNLSLPALAYVSLEAKGRELSIRATNLDVGLRINLPAKVEEEGQVMVSGSVMANFLSSLYHQDKVELTTVTNTLTVATANTTSVLKTYPTDDFPTIPEISDGQTLSIPATQLVAGLRSVIYAASFSDIKPEIASVYLYGTGDELVFVATDSFRLAEKRLRLKTKLTEEPKLIIPIKNSTELVRIFEGIDDEVMITYNGHQVAFATDQIYLTSRLVEGVFPDYRQIMPTSYATEVIMLKNDLLNTLKLSTIFSDKLNQITVRAGVKDKIFEITSRNTDVGESTSRVSATLSGDEVEISFNVRYLLDSLSSIAPESLRMAFNGKQRPIVIRGEGDNSFTYLIMPLNR
jgi:DNA polymerase-3 subunit beta